MKRTLQVRSGFVRFVLDDGRGKSGGEWLEITPVFSIRRGPWKGHFQEWELCLLLHNSLFVFFLQERFF
jgi:hypothetical protein